MAVILSTRFGAGKTTLARKLCFEADVGDRVIACGLAGGYSATMAANGGCSNFVPTLRAVLDLSHAQRAVDPFTGTPSIAQDVLAGNFFQFVNGIYMPSSFASICINSVGALNARAWCFDARGDFSTYDTAMFVVLVADTASGDSGCDVLVRSELVFDKVTPEFKGFPYIRLGESSVQPPMAWAHPVVRGVQPHDFGEKVLGALLERYLEEPAALQQVTRALNTITPGNAAMYSATYANDVIGAAIEAVPDAVLGAESRALRDTYRAVKTAETRLRISRMHKEKAEFRTHDSHVILNSHGRPYMDNVPAIELILGLGRCVVDSITSVVMGTAGTALAGGLPATFVAALAATNHSEAILYYTPLSLDERGDPFAGKQIGGYVDGYVYSDRGTIDSLMDSPDDEFTYYVSTRHASTSRMAKHLLYRQGCRYGTHVYRTADGRLHRYPTQLGRFDPSLEVSQVQPGVVLNPLTTLEYSPLSGDQSTASVNVTAAELKRFANRRTGLYRR